MIREQAPECKNPQCPGPRDQMVLLEETESHYTFGCKRCRDVNRVLSIQIRTKPLFRGLIAQQIQRQPFKRAQQVQRDRVGRIKYFI